MSDKPRAKLNELDRMLRDVTPISCKEGCIPTTKITIELITGFELFNTRPYHNYESWSNGYRISGFGVKVEREDLDDAVRDFCKKVVEKSSKEEEEK